MKIWNSSGTAKASLPHTGAIYGLAFAPGGKRLVAASADGTATVWDTSGPEARLVCSLKGQGGHKGPVSTVAFFDHGRRLATASHDGTAKLWRGDDAGRWECFRTLQGHSSGINRIAIGSRRPTLLCSAGDDRSIRLWDLEKAECLHAIVGYADCINAVRFVNDRTIVTGSDNRAIRIWELPKGTCKQELRADVGRVNYLAVGPGGQVVATARVMAG